ncbi:sporulation inhibitor of replication protein SirA [Cytobacillus oceanisediminis]|uniref:Sporulation inhibitor of replication protein SirA n=2 Tax=Bacillales TaxID=1385 RepID=A0A7Y0K8B0_9BACI|nr:sporulation inhibitor of replication protein SirA [Bacillus sp. (in: firmicutes)]MBZ9535825.1 sporulation inhibitor of replication protein SirA [Cytobacillus oceanisediminis]NMO77684.1 sporulation inhibitor of replication protein SirA [Niallia alba]
MRRYQLYLIKEKIAIHYNGRERLFYNLFSDHTKTDDGQPLKEILQKQVDFITLPISKWMIENQLYAALQRNKSFQYKDGVFYIENGNLSSASLMMKDDYLYIEADGYYDAESIFFEIIRKHEPSFLAIDIENDRFGWLKPIKERNFV